MFGRRKFIVMENELALLFHRGKLVHQLGPGRHIYWGADYDLMRFDMRQMRLHVSGQEVSCQDGITVRASVRGLYRYIDIEKAFRSSESAFALAYDVIHETLRAVVAAVPIDEVINNRAELSAALLATAAPKCQEYGIELTECSISDLAVTGEIKRAYGKLLVAQKEGQAALERARGESAALRNLANAARMMDDNPNLLQLRWIMAAEHGKGTSVVVSPHGPAAPTDP